MPVLTSKGQVTIPKPVRDLLHIREGDSVVFEVMGEVVVVKKEDRKSILSMGGIAGESAARGSRHTAKKGRH